MRDGASVAQRVHQPSAGSGPALECRDRGGRGRAAGMKRRMVSRKSNESRFGGYLGRRQTFESSVAAVICFGF